MAALKTRLKKKLAMLDKVIEIPISPHRVQVEYVDDFYPCIVCGRPVKSANPKMLRIVEGGFHTVLPEFQAEYDRDPGDMGLYPIGPDCLRRNPHLKPYTQVRQNEL